MPLFCLEKSTIDTFLQIEKKTRSFRITRTHSHFRGFEKFATFRIFQDFEEIRTHSPPFACEWVRNPTQSAMPLRLVSRWFICHLRVVYGIGTKQSWRTGPSPGPMQGRRVARQSPERRSGLRKPWNGGAGLGMRHANGAHRTPQPCVSARGRGERHTQRRAPMMTPRGRGAGSGGWGDTCRPPLEGPPSADVPPVKPVAGRKGRAGGRCHEGWRPQGWWTGSQSSSSPAEHEHGSTGARSCPRHPLGRDPLPPKEIRVSV